ncbi:MAG: hypothetical protein B7Z15_13620 [Rhizobiales bacterium 32-66-8]|nr:MAG: hypothetical protein B7Z15_13620 [Rhizobiales bacterium 32-66-8]
MPTALYAYLLPLAALLLGYGGPLMSLPASTVFILLAMALLMGSALSAVQHAERIAARLRPPFGTLVLTFSVTTIEVSVLASLMLHGGNNPTLAREAVLSTVMFVLTGVVGLCMLVGGLRHREQEVHQQGLAGYLSVIIAISVLALILPDVTWSRGRGPIVQTDVIFIMLGVVALYGSFLFMQTVRYRDHYIGTVEEHSAPPQTGAFLAAIAFLLLSLWGVVVLSTSVAAGVERLVIDLHLEDPDAVVGAVVVTMLLLPETITAVKAARRNQLQRALNTALGSALATIGLTMPAMVAIGYVLNQHVELSLDPEDRIQLLLALIISIVSFGTGKTNQLTGHVHLVLFFIYVMTLFTP